MKATEDTTYTDPTFNTNLAGAKAAGIYAAPYHFCRLDTGSSDPAGDAAAEANYFLSKIKSKYQSNNYLPPMSDLETWPSGLTTAALKTLTTAWEKSFSDTIYNALGVRPLLYTSQSKATSLFSSSNTTDPLVVAAWHTTMFSSPPANSASALGALGRFGNGVMIPPLIRRMAPSMALQLEFAWTAMFFKAPPLKFRPCWSEKIRRQSRATSIATAS